MKAFFSRPLAVFGLLTVLMVLPSSCMVLRELGVGGDDPQWLKKTYKGVRRSDLIDLVQLVLAKHELKIGSVDEVEGEVESQWLYHLFEPMSHRDLRAKVIARVSEVDEMGVEVKVRVKREVAKDIGRHLEPRLNEWTVFDDDVSHAQILMQDIDIVAQGVIMGAEESAGAED